MCGVYIKGCTGDGTSGDCAKHPSSGRMSSATKNKMFLRGYTVAMARGNCSMDVVKTPTTPSTGAMVYVKTQSTCNIHDFLAIYLETDVVVEISTYLEMIPALACYHPKISFVTLVSCLLTREPF